MPQLDMAWRECGPGSPALVVPLAADIPEIVIPVDAPSGASIGGAEHESGLRHDPLHDRVQLRAVSSLGGFRTPAPGVCGCACEGPASDKHNLPMQMPPMP